MYSKDENSYVMFVDLKSYVKGMLTHYQTCVPTSLCKKYIKQIRYRCNFSPLFWRRACTLSFNKYRLMCCHFIGVAEATDVAGSYR